MAATRSRATPKRKKAKTKTPRRANSEAKKRPAPERAPVKRSPVRAGKRKSVKRNWRIACASLAEVRSNIDRLDAKIAPLLCARLDFVTQAAQFKPSVAGVVVPSRVEEIIDTVRAVAVSMGVSPNTMEQIYRELIDASTADEQRRWRGLHE